MRCAAAPPFEAILTGAISSTTARTRQAVTATPSSLSRRDGRIPTGRPDGIPDPTASDHGGAAVGDQLHAVDVARVV